MSHNQTTRRPLLQALFLAAMLLALVMASLPQPPQLPGEPSDKVQHILAFTVLTLLASLAWPHAPKWKILAALSAFGTLIEAVQAIPALHRDASLLDWLADTAAIAVTLGLAPLARRMARCRAA